jgi:hypothetical protein
MCSACKHLGLSCEYKRPMWWSNNDARRKHKDDIKMIIKRKKLSEKASHNMQTSAGSPPGLSHSLPTSATFSDSFDRTRSASIDSHFAFNFSSPGSSQYDNTPFTTPQMQPDFIFSPFSPYDIDVKTERQMYVNDVPTLRESTTSTFSAYTPPPPGTVLPSFPLAGEWTEQVYSERRESMTSEATMSSMSSSNMSSCDMFPFSQPLTVDASQIGLEVDEGDKRLLDHFVQFVAPTLFPVLEASPLGTTGADLAVLALQSNKSYLHCCLSVAAQHYKTAMGIQGEEIDGEIMRHRYATISALCDALNKDENHQQILDAALGLIYFRSSVGRFDDALPDIPWSHHFTAAVSLVQKLDLPRIVSEEPTEPLAAQSTPFNMSLMSWIDILGATMQGRAPTFAHTYREKHLSPTNPSLGLRELMGCEDRVLYLISEIACLEALKKDGMDDITLCQHVQVLGEQIGLTEMAEAAASGLTVPPSPKLPFNMDSSLDSIQLSRNITAAFRLAARIYLCSLVPGFSPTQSSCAGLIEKLTSVLSHIPAGPTGFDRSVVWVYLVAGAVSTPGSGFRAFFEDRVARLGDFASFGSFGRVNCLLREVWAQNDDLFLAQDGQESPVSAGSEGPQSHIHWRDVMQIKGWDFLLI